MPVDISSLTKDDVARKMDYAILNQAWPEERYLEGCENTRRYRFVAYHVLPSRVALVVRELGSFAREHSIELGAPIAFPYGSTPTEVKLAEAEHLIGLGATALDMVANIGWLKDRRYELYQKECSEHIALCHAAGINGKVIIEVGHLSDEEIVAATKMVIDAGADFVKTATGTGPAGFPDFHQAQLILNTLRAAHGNGEFLAALDRAVAFCRWRPADIRSILAAGAGVPEPRVPAGDALNLDLPAVPVRPLADYAIGALS